MNSIGRKIKEARINAKLTEKQLAKKCGVAESFIINVESGRKVINEKTAETILKKLGGKLESILQQDTGDENVTIKENKGVEKPKEQFNPIELTGQWADALANVIKKYPIYEVGTNKVVGHKDLPVLEKKVEGYRWDKILFARYGKDDLEGLKIVRDSNVMVLLTRDIQNNGIYLFELAGKRVIRLLRKESSKIYMYKSVKDDPETVDMREIKLIGKCVKVELEL